MKCAECAAEGERSQVYPGSTITTAMAVYRYYDEDGRLHVHDPNRWTTSYRCSRGHEWKKSERPRCPICGTEGF